ncbi:HepT-like ribonuclease domain-containing protein [Parapedobacter defluvii]|uniref:HepT-like ribonuclease domain-containing protein n=1 Tax=Parapedobacter defluvii TaxID=2045106 RepID=UPI0016681BCD
MEKLSSIYLHHILECISRIRAYTKDIDEQAFLKDFLLQDAVIRNFEVLKANLKRGCLTF